MNINQTCLIDVLSNWDSRTEKIGTSVIADMYYKYKIFDLDKPIIITFPIQNVQVKEDPNIAPYAFDYLSKFDANLICFDVLGNHNDNYFTHQDFSSFLEKLSLYLKKFKIRLGYSNSKGGFGIGAYAKTLCLDSVLLFFPISTKKSALIPWDNRPSTKQVNHLNWDTKYSDVDLGDCKGFVIYDPTDQIDKNHARRFKGLKHIKIYGFAHGQGYNFLVRFSECIKNIMSDFIYNQKINLVKLRQEAKALRLTGFYYDALSKEKNSNNMILLKNKKKLEGIINHNLNRQLITKSNIFNKVDIDEIRDIAITLENTDLESAYRLMKLAQKGRPNGSFIEKKVKQYEKRLKNAST